MSLKLLARDLYDMHKEVERLEQQLAAAAIEERAALEEPLRRARKDRDYLRRALDGRLGR